MKDLKSDVYSSGLKMYTLDNIMSEQQFSYHVGDTLVTVKHDMKLEKLSSCIPKKSLATMLDRMITNSIEANSRSITIETCCDETYCYITVSDDGDGLDRKYCKDPRNILCRKESTKHKEQVRGMGLYLSLQIAKGYNGDIDVENGPILKIKLPLKMEINEEVLEFNSHVS